MWVHTRRPPVKPRSLARARGPAHSLARARDLDLDRADASFILCLSLSRSRARDSRAFTCVSFHFVSFHCIRPRRRSVERTNGCARTSLARGDDADEDADDAFVRVSSFVWLVVSRRDARALDEDEEDVETEEDDDAAGGRRRGRFSIRPERVADVRG